MIKKWIVLGFIFAALASLAVASAQAGTPARQPSAPEAALGTTFTY